MTVSHSMTDLLCCLLLYSFLGWAAEMGYFTIKNKRFVNSGFLDLPFALPYGIAAVLLITALPTLQHNIPLQYVLTLTYTVRFLHLYLLHIQRSPRFTCPLSYDTHWKKSA